jgi:hypothetical protein
LGPSGVDAFVVDRKGGVWGTAIALPGATALGSGTQVSSVSCASTGNCAAAGTDFGGFPGVFAAAETNGVWGNAANVLGLSALSVTTAFDWPSLAGISCAKTVGTCALGGYYRPVGAVNPAEAQAYVTTP